MVASREVVYLNDFSGGLNLTTQLQTLAPNESPDCLNVDFGYRGGFVLRGGFRTQKYSSQLTSATFLCPTYFGADVVLLAASNGSLLSWDGSALTDTTNSLTADTDYSMVATTFNSKAYIAGGRSASAFIMQSWDGSSLTTLGTSMNDDYTVPTDGNMPLGRLIARHNGYMWVADTVESTVRYPHRVRFSHVQQPEDWASADYFDVDPGDDGDPVTAIVPFKDRLMIFKRSSVWALFGETRSEFQLERISTVSGVNDSRSVTTNSGVCYWFASDGAVMAYNGSGVVPLTDTLRWWADLGRIDVGGDHKIQWADGRLYLGLKAASGEGVVYWFFVYDPVIKAMTRYSLEPYDMLFWNRVDADSDFLVLCGCGNLFLHDRETSSDLIDSGSGAVATRISAYYRTGWLTAGETATKKRWKRPRVTAAADGAATIRMRVYHDFVEDTLVKYSELVIDSGDVSLWGSIDWGDDWSSGVDDFYEFKRLSSGGSAHAIQFEFTSLDNAGRWWVDSIAVPFRRKEVR